MEYIVKVLKLLLENSALNQRELSRKVGVSLGKINNILKECIKDELIIKKKISNNIRYIVTSKGKSVLGDSIKKIKDTILAINEEENYKITQAVILAGGKSIDFTQPVASLKISNIEIVRRTVDILKENGINKIVIVTGYKEEYIKEVLKNDSSILWVKNDKYKWTGTMYSLALAEQYIDDDFILVESDLVFEKQAILGVLKYNNRDCLLITNESGSGDEAFVQLKNGNLFKMSKDIHHFNRIDGEMIGISKISNKLFEMMINEFQYNINPYLNYEYLLLDISRDYKVPCIKIDDLIWGEVDNRLQFDKINNYLFQRIIAKDIKIEKENIKNAIINNFKINEEDIDNINPAGGMTNKNYKVSIKGEDYIVRIPGVGTENMISRTNEMINSKLGSEIGVNVEILEFDLNSGIKLSKFVNGAETLNPRTAKKEENIRLVAKILRDVHYSNIDMKNYFNAFKEIERYESILENYDIEYYDNYKIIRSKVMEIENLIKDFSYNLVPSHNDTVPENFIKDESGRMYLIDWEYSGLNDEMWDIAAFSIECDFSADDEELFLNYYFNGKITRENKIKILMNKILQDFLWSIWTLIKEAEGDGFGDYGINRYNRARKNLEILETLI